MMTKPTYDAFLKFNRSDRDLRPFRESWKSDTYENRLNTIKESMVASGRQKGTPSPNMIIIKEGVFPVDSHVLIPDLITLSEIIRREFMIECFQITIDRQNNLAHMLFDWYDQDKMQSYSINRSEHIMLSVLIVKTLNITEPVGAEEWGVYYVKYWLKYHPHILGDILKTAKRTFDSRVQYEALKDITNYLGVRQPSMVG